MDIAKVGDKGAPVQLAFRRAKHYAGFLDQPEAESDHGVVNV